MMKVLHEKSGRCGLYSFSVRLLVICFGAFFLILAGNITTRADEGSVLVTVSAVNSWQEEGMNCFQYSISIQNDSFSQIDGWKLSFQSDDTLTIQSFWNCNADVSEGGFILENVGYNAMISPGGAVTDIGVIIGLGGSDSFSGTYLLDLESGGLTQWKEDGAQDHGENQERENQDPEGEDQGENQDPEGGNQSVTPQYPEGSGMYGSLLVNGTTLCSAADGAPVQLCGVSTHGLSWFPDYVNENAFRQLRDEWGANLIRLAMYTEEYGGYCSGGNQAALEQLIDKGVQACTALGMYCIIDWHILSDGNPNTHLAEAKDFFSRMSQKYSSFNNVLYEICNEPNGGTSWNMIKSYADQVIPVIRENAPDAIILVGTPTWSQDIDQVAAAPVENPYNVMYTLHFYAATHGEYLRQRLLSALAADTPVFISEFSFQFVTRQAAGRSAIRRQKHGKT